MLNLLRFQNKALEILQPFGLQDQEKYAKVYARRAEGQDILTLLETGHFNFAITKGRFSLTTVVDCSNLFSLIIK